MRGTGVVGAGETAKKEPRLLSNSSLQFLMLNPCVSFSQVRRYSIVPTLLHVRTVATYLVFLSGCARCKKRHSSRYAFLGDQEND